MQKNSLEPTTECTTKHLRIACGDTTRKKSRYATLPLLLGRLFLQQLVHLGPRTLAAAQLGSREDWWRTGDWRWFGTGGILLLFGLECLVVFCAELLD
jgi:hypothetical protein